MAFARGCPRSMMDTGRLINYFSLNGIRLIPRLDQADAVLVGTCGFDIRHENESLHYLSIAHHRKKPSAPLIAYGCLAGINGDRLKQALPLIPFRRQDYEKLDLIIGAVQGFRQCRDLHDFEAFASKVASFRRRDHLRVRIRSNLTPSALGRGATKLFATPFLSGSRILKSGSRPVPSRHDFLQEGPVFNIRTSSGCNNSCTYCAIRRATGPLRSRPLDAVLADLDLGLERGYPAFRLVAEDVGAYGRDRGSSAVDLFRGLFRKRGTFCLMFDDFSPRWLVDYASELIPIFQKNAHRLGLLGIPFESGSSEVLGRMERGYTAEAILKIFRIMTEKIPDIQLGTHVMVGFPGETDEAFLRTLGFLDHVPFSRIAVHAYSDRPGTKASGFQDKIPERVKTIRKIKVKQHFIGKLKT
jgi:tRNA A37 methylthiotransferase MiaB